jgi:hypothetical protein
MNLLLSLWLATLLLVSTAMENDTLERDAHLRSKSETRTGNIIFFLLLYLNRDFKLDNAYHRRSKRQCLYLFGDKCICRERQLRSAIRENREVLLCHDTNIRVSSSIDIGGKFINLICAGIYDKDSDNHKYNCKISAKGSFRVFVGVPTSFRSEEVVIVDGSSVPSPPPILPPPLRPVPFPSLAPINPPTAPVPPV